MSPQHQNVILIIEDDESVRRTLADILELNGYQTLVAANGTEGLALARRDSPDVVITDLNMPGLTGFDLLETFRQDETLRAIPVIVITAKVDRAATRHGMELGAADFITKPFSEEEVLHSVAARLEKKALIDELDAFAHTVAHDLKSPLATLVGRLEILGLNLARDDKAKTRLQLEEAVNSSLRLGNIINELLVLTGVRRQHVSPQALDLPAIVHEAVDRVENILKQKQATVVKPDTWPTSFGHPPWVVEIFVNYLSNAAKYGGPAPVITLGAETRPDGRFVRYWVQDPGPGLDDEAKARMFVPFTRISTVRAKGHGLGLSIVRRIVEKLGGTVGVTSSPGAGARFWFELPASRPQTRPPFAKA